MHRQECLCHRLMGCILPPAGVPSEHQSASGSPMPPDPAPRVTSLDAYRGFVMFLMMAEALALPKVAKEYPNEPVWQFVKFHTDHVPWEWGSLHDLIQPSFSFLVGAAAVFSLASRRRRGEPFWLSLLHAIFRSAFLIWWG